MPAAAAIATGVGLVIGVAGLALSIFQTTEEDPSLAKLDDLADDLDRLQDSLSDLGEDLMREFQVIEDLIPTVAINQAVADSTAARGALQRLLRIENPSESQRLDVIGSAETALLRVQAQARLQLDGDSPASALGFAAALSFAAATRIEIAYRLEDGAVGAETLRQSLQLTSDYLTRIAEQVPELLRDAITVETTVDIRPAGSGYFVDYSTVASSPVSDQSVSSSKSNVYYPDGFAYISGHATEMAYRTNSLEPALLEQRANLDYDTLRFAELPEAAQRYADLADGDDILGTNRSDSLTGTEGNDLLTGLRGNDILDGGADADVLYGGSGDDLMRGGEGQDVLDGGAGKDRLFGQSGEDRMLGGTGRDRLKGGGGDDELNGGKGNDRLVGGSGDDLIAGNMGSDYLVGGGGADTFVFGTNPTRGTDTIKGFRTGEDRIELDSTMFDKFAPGPLSDALLEFGAEATSRSATLLYDNGRLSYDADGSRPGEPAVIAVLTRDPALSADDIFII